MPEDADYVDYLFGPMTYSVWWLIGAALVVLLVAAWVLGVFVWTLPVEALRGIPVVRAVSFRVLRFKFTRSLANVEQRHREGQLPTREAFHEVSRLFRLFIALRTGYQAREMTVTDIANSPLPQGARNVVSMIYPGQFDEVDPRSLPAVVEAARTAVAAWT